jgi:hypothetical protein
MKIPDVVWVLQSLCGLFLVDNDKRTNDVFRNSHHAFDARDCVWFAVENGEDEIAVAHFVDFVSKPAAAFLVGCFNRSASAFDEFFNGKDYSVYCVFIKVWPDDVDNFVWFYNVAGQWFSPLVVCPASQARDVCITSLQLSAGLKARQTCRTFAKFYHVIQIGVPYA